MQRINLLLISEDVEVEDSEDEESIIDDDYDPDADYLATEKKKQTKYHYCGIKNLNRLLFDQNKCKNKTDFCDRCLYGFTRED